jgi:hypothetical protein
MRVRTCVLLLVLVSGCQRSDGGARRAAGDSAGVGAAPGGGDTSPIAPLPEDTVIAAAPADSALAARLASLKDSLDRRLRAESVAGYERIAMFEDSSLHVVAAGEDWPERTVTSYGVLRDAGGAVRMTFESPASQSGDWFNAHAHYFDDAGRLFAYERHSSFFVGCPVPARETAETYYSPTGRVLRRDYELTAFDTTQAVAKRDCTFLVRMPYAVHRSWRQWAAATRVGQLRPPGGAAVP